MPELHFYRDSLKPGPSCDGPFRLQSKWGIRLDCGAWMADLRRGGFDCRNQQNGPPFLGLIISSSESPMYSSPYMDSIESLV